MPISSVLFDKWDERLYFWYLWLAPDGKADGADAKISSIYNPELWQKGYGSPSSGVFDGEARETDALMTQIQIANPNIYHALKSWAGNYGTRGAQAQKLSIHQDTYRDRVDSGMAQLQRLARARSQAQIKSRRLLPERA